MPAPGPIRRAASAARRLVGGRRPDRPSPPGAGPPVAGPTVAGVTIQYLPEHDGDPDPGEVVWAWVPYEDDPDQGKDRPVLVLGRDGDLLACVPLSSKDPSHRHDAHTRVAVGTGGWDRARRPSWADCERLLRFRVDEIRREGSSIDRARFDAVVVRARAIHGP